MQSALAEIAEDLVVTSSGTVASMTFTLDEGKLEELLKARKELELGPPPDPDIPR